MTISSNSPSFHSIQRELITGSVIIAAIVMFIWTGGSAMTAVVRYVTGVGPNVEQILLTTLLLNIALILFGWRRYRDLEIEVQCRRDAEERARSLADTDPLTGFLNRRSIAEKGTALLAETRSTGQSAAMFLIDLDNFKQVNDVHGHAAGDHVLTVAARRIAAQLPPPALTARLGGDEFACIFSFDPDQPGIVDEKAGALVSDMTDLVELDGFHVAVSMSIGIAQTQPDCDAIDALMRRADIAMYSAKKQGRNRYARFDASMEHELNVRNQLEAGIRQGIKNSEFLPFYEPQTDPVTGQLIGFHMHMRWIHPTEGLLLPDQFAAVAEECRLGTELSLSVMRRAFEDARSWDPSLTLSINISQSQIKDPWLSQKIRKLLVETGFPPSRLEVAIAESSLFENLSLAHAIVGSLNNQGIRIAIDDFGMGYGSLAYMRALPFDRIRMSRDFVSPIDQQGSDVSRDTLIERLGETFGLPVSVEGANDKAPGALLRDSHRIENHDNHVIQPMPVEQTRRMLADRNLLVSGTSGKSTVSHDRDQLDQPAADTGRKAG